ncbi:hypothetical protein IFM89_012230 [Coptis chinensis]|uniref:Uncharacterized protein n=1 Tax=Coptis chinensis TaxID=261450 RepID=A0A835LM34_9MAGN|nr:hypothetical protein IFM89_012230 [Coptis chinensis]
MREYEAILFPSLPSVLFLIFFFLITFGFFSIIRKEKKSNKRVECKTIRESEGPSLYLLSTYNSIPDPLRSLIFNGSIIGPLKASATEQESILALRDQVFRIWGLLQSSEDFDPSMLQPIIQANCRNVNGGAYGAGAQVLRTFFVKRALTQRFTSWIAKARYLHHSTTWIIQLEAVVAIDINVPKQLVQRKQRLPATEGILINGDEMVRAINRHSVTHLPTLPPLLMALISRKALERCDLGTLKQV